MNDYKKIIDEWMQTDEYLCASDPTTIGANESQRVYLENRLRRAFDAGFSSGIERQRKLAMEKIADMLGK